MEFKPLFELVRSAFPAGSQVYLVGGAVRDLLLGKALHDLDFTLAGNTRKVAQAAARKLNSPFFMLDDHRLTARVVFRPAEGEEIQLDFAALAHNDLETDLRQRDFTINAVAVEVSRPDVFIDPCGGQPDLEAGLLRACSPQSMLNDPLRVLRGVRLAFSLNLTILPETEALMTQAAPGLASVSPERQRDELLRILEGPQPESAIRLLDRLGVLPILMPELEALKGMEQTKPHVLDAWEHTLSTLYHLDGLLDTLMNPSQPGVVIDPWWVKSAACLEDYRELVHAYLATQIVPNRSLRSLLFFAALYHDIAKPVTVVREESGMIHYYGHAEIGAEMVANCARSLALSKAEIVHLQQAVACHMRVHLLAQNNMPISRRAIYRFYKTSGEAGVDVCLLSLADTLATYGPGLPDAIFENEVSVCRALLDAWWKKPAESVRPLHLLNGNDLKDSMGLEPGPRIGQLLELLSEAQAAGEVATRDEALAFMRKKYEDPHSLD
jgi:tRNA nucleotidyltransferase/poly(A) polymerase